MRCHLYLAVIYPSQCPRVLPRNADGMGPLLGEPCVVNDLHSLTHASALDHLLDTQAVHLPRLPIRTRKKLLQPLSVRPSYCSTKVRCRLSPKVSYKPRRVTLQSVSALRPPHQTGERLQKLPQVA